MSPEMWRCGVERETNGLEIATIPFAYLRLHRREMDVVVCAELSGVVCL